jgi:hypothetical protein
MQAGHEVIKIERSGPAPNVAVVLQRESIYEFFADH